VDLHTCSNFIEGLKDISILARCQFSKIMAPKLMTILLSVYSRELSDRPFSVHMHFGHLTSLNLMGGLDDGGNISKPS
jgi:hypothetical protein